MKLATLADSEIMMTLIALACLLASAFIAGKLFEKIQTPKAVGEIIGGMLFGGTFLGVVAPELMESIFNSFSEEGKVLNFFYQLGLSFLIYEDIFRAVYWIHSNSNAGRISVCKRFFLLLYWHGEQLCSIPACIYYRNCHYIHSGHFQNLL